MAHLGEHQSVFSLDSTSGGSLVDYSDDVTQITFPSISNNMTQYHTLDDRAPKSVIGGWTGSFSVSVVRDNDASSLHRVLEAWITEDPPVARTVQIDTPDSNTGSERYTAEVLPQSYTPGQASGGSGNASIGQATLMIAGSFTISTIS